MKVNLGVLVTMLLLGCGPEEPKPIPCPLDPEVQLLPHQCINRLKNALIEQKAKVAAQSAEQSKPTPAAKDGDGPTIHIESSTPTGKKGVKLENGGVNIYLDCRCPGQQTQAAPGFPWMMTPAQNDPTKARIMQTTDENGNVLWTNALAQEEDGDFPTTGLCDEYQM